MNTNQINDLNQITMKIPNRFHKLAEFENNKYLARIALA